ncbi:MAG: hypothetical protein EBU52_03190 [Cytophagia bacterium]|nr:hypothetical protein [Cytophagia bacterium]
MKDEKVIYGLGTCMVIGGAILKIMHIPYANTLLMSGLIGTSLFQSWLIAQLKSKVTELEQKNQSRA